MKKKMEKKEQAKTLKHEGEEVKSFNKRVDLSHARYIYVLVRL